MKTILQLKVALILILTTSLGANSQYVDYDRDTKWNIGFNMGGVWQDGDIKLDRPGFGYGFTLGRSIYESPGKFWGLDVRFRYLKGFTYGQNLSRTDSTDSYLDNTIYSTNPTNYRNNVGFTYLNSKTMIHDFSLEAVINFHKLREKTGVLLSVYGGIGITDYRTKTDLLDENDKIYNYFNIDSVNATKRDFRNLQDRDYETNSVYNDDVTVKFMPSLGIGLGYQVTPKFSVGFEHRVTFVLQDKFDGQEAPGTQFLQWGDNDKYHYTSFFLRWNIFRGSSSTTTTSRNCPPPYLKIADIPEVYTVNEKVFSVRARVSKIKSNNDIILVNNDQIVETIYNSNTDYVSATVFLNEGSNKLLFIASNECGESLDSVMVIYNPDYCPKAVVTVLKPNADTSSSKEVDLEARILQLQGGTITVKLNGNKVVHSFNASAKKLTTKLNLNLGMNTVSIHVANKCGDTTVFKNIVYHCVAPIVSIVKPTNGAVYKTGSLNVEALVKNIQKKSQMEVVFNGKKINLNFDGSRGRVSGGINLIEGVNTMSITVTNDCGTDTKTVSFTYDKPCLLPVATIASPRNGFNSTNSSINVRGTVTNITTTSNVQLLLNGVAVNSNFNQGNGSFSTTLNLRRGSNTIELIGVNVCGQDKKMITVSYNCPTPTVSIISPVNGSKLTSNQVTFRGAVTNVTNKSEISLTVNGSAIPFSFSSSTRSFNASVSLSQGQNVLVASVTTACGTDSRTHVVTVDVPCPAPVVNILSPSNGTSVSTNVITLSGSVLNITAQSQMTVKLNGVSQSFSFNNASKTFAAALSLIQGNNTIQVSANTNCGNATKTISVVYNKACPVPVVNLLSPSNGTTVTTGLLPINGTALHINSKSDMQVLLNGSSQGFAYNSSSKAFNANLNLREGANVIVVTATTNCGTDSKTITVNYTKLCPKPVVSITTPRNGLNSTSTRITFTGRVSNVQNSSQVVLKLNGNAVAKNFNSITGIVSASLNLRQGGNTIELVGTNSCGTDNQLISVSYKCPLPTVNIASPNQGMSYTNSPVSFSGFVSGISSKSQIKVTVNGTSTSFTYDTRTSKFSGSMNLIEGNNILVATVTNNCGTVNKSTLVTYTKPCPKPTVVITSPSTGNVSTPKVQITGVARNINSQSDLQLKVNGTNTAFSYNATTKIFTASVNLIVGTNTIIASVATNCGNDLKTVSVTYAKPCPKPSVTILNPKNGAKPTNQFITINGTVLNINSKAEMTLKLNGINIPFTYNASTKTFTANYDLTAGNNVITATVTNACGTDSKTVNIGWTPPCPKPAVSIGFPGNGVSVTTPTIQVSGTVTNINSQSDFQLKVNGSNANFTYNSSTNSFTTSVTLKEGNNVILATAATNCGNSAKTINVFYKKPCPKPSVTILNPKNGTAPTNQFITINGTVLNINSKAEMTLKLNGTNIPFTYNGSAKTFTANYDLTAGNNVITATVTNACGSDSKTVRISWAPPCPKPVVTISSPRNGLTVNGNKVTITGTATNLTTKADMQIRLNGAVQNFTYSASSKTYSALLTLRGGSNSIKVDAATNCGNDSKSIGVTSVIKIKPIVRVDNPVKDTSATSASQMKVFGEVQKITGRTKFAIKVNGTDYTGFTFNKTGTERYVFDGLVNLKPGLNVITFTAVHATGGVQVVTKVITVNTNVLSPNKGRGGEVEQQGGQEVSPGGRAPRTR